MCHTSAMKKSLVLLAPLLALLVSCGQFETGLTSERHSAGFDNSTSHFQYSSIEYTYYAGDEVDTTNSSVARFSFDSRENYSFISKEQLEPLVTCDNPNVEYQIKEVASAGIKADVGFFIGLDSNYVDGSLTIAFGQAVKGVIIRARRYYAFTNAWNEDNVVIDDDVAIAINNSKYIKLTGEKDASGIPNTSECRYNAQNHNEIKIKVGPKRAIIEEIAFYF